MEQKPPSKGKLHLIPSSLGEGAAFTIPSYILPIIATIEVFIVEHERTARRFLRSIGYRGDFDQAKMYRLDKRTPPEDWRQYLQDALQGEDVGLLSEAGCPGVADPGAQVVGLAHEKGIKVVPLVGPSAILLALMASGMNGQQFCFNGYLPIKGPERIQAIKQLEQQAQKGTTQIFMETPYRNNQLLEDLLQHAQPHTRLCIACDITLPTEFIRTQTLKAWKSSRPDLHKRPAVFLLG